jgi:hypothetical protein
VSSSATTTSGAVRIIHLRTEHRQGVSAITSADGRYARRTLYVALNQQDIFID